MKWHTEQRKVNELIPYIHNPRLLTDKQQKDLERSLKKFDLVEIPAINTDGTIIAGHQRVGILQLLGRGEELIDVRIPDTTLTEEEVKEYNIRSNKNTGQWDFHILSEDFDINKLAEWGFTEDELDNIQVPDFQSDSEENQGKLDEKDPIICPSCGHEFEP